MSDISDEAYEELQRILEKQYGKTLAIEEVREIGNGLLDFYAFLIKVNDSNEDEIEWVRSFD